MHGYVPGQRNATEGSITVVHTKADERPRSLAEIAADLAVAVDALIEAERWFLRTERELTQAEHTRATRTVDIEKLHAELAAAQARG
jgi:hypothetical protein